MSSMRESLLKSQKTRFLATTTWWLAVLAVVAACGGASQDTDSVATDGTFTLSSTAVVNGRLLPEYRCELKVDGVEESIPLTWTDGPASAGSLAIIMYHYPDPKDTSRVSSYLLLWGIDPTVTEIPHGQADDGDWFMGSNKDGTAISYTSPCSKGKGMHEYTITIYALSETPKSLPRSDSLEVTYDVLTKAFQTVTVIDTASLTFADETP